MSIFSNTIGYPNTHSTVKMEEESLTDHQKKTMMEMPFQSSFPLNFPQLPLPLAGFSPTQGLIPELFGAGSALRKPLLGEDLLNMMCSILPEKFEASLPKNLKMEGINSPLTFLIMRKIESENPNATQLRQANSLLRMKVITFLFWSG